MKNSTIIVHLSRVRDFGVAKSVGLYCFALAVSDMLLARKLFKILLYLLQAEILVI